MLRGRDLIMIFDRFVGPKKGSGVAQDARVQVRTPDGDRKSTRLNSSH